MIKRILCVHQGYELYGSDRTFLSCVDFLRERFPAAAIDVVLPKAGDLSAEFARRGIEVTIDDVWVLRKSYGFLGLVARVLKLPFAVWRAARRCRDHDLVYINTGVIVDYLLASRAYRQKCRVHIHEIPGKLSSYVFRALMEISRAPALFNSVATRDSYALSRGIPQFVVHNGVDIADGAGGALLPEAGRPLKLLLIGRINSWKGQAFLVEALAKLPAEIRARVSVRIVGDAFEGAPYRDRLVARIAQTKMGETVTVEPFMPDPSEAYAWADVVVVPSLKAEPFGLVAIEAMGHGRAVIAANHGGLSEIVVDGVTGWFHRPGDLEDLGAAIRLAVEDRDAVADCGAAGRLRYTQRFTLEAFRTAFIDAIVLGHGGEAMS